MCVCVCVYVILVRNYLLAFVSFQQNAHPLRFVTSHFLIEIHI